MKKFIIVSAVAAMATMAYADDAGLKAELDALKAQVAELKKAQENANLKGLADQVKELKVRTGGDNIKWDADYRVTYDMLSYKMANGDKLNNGVLANRLILGAKAAPRNDLSFIAKVAYNKVFGDTANHSQTNTPSLANFDWVTNENMNDNTLRVKTAYAIYFGNMGDVPYTASIGRRSSTNGLMVNMRDDDEAGSPNGHMINVEFDGASFKFDLDKVTGVPGMSFKLCMGRGLTNAAPRFSMTNGAGTKMQQADYVNDPSKNRTIDMFGFIYTPYDDGQYAVHTQAFKAWNLIGYSMMNSTSMQGVQAGFDSLMSAGNYAALPTFFNTVYSGFQTPGAVPAMMGDVANGGFETVGNIYGGTVSAIATGIGSGISDFLDNTTAFVSYSVSKTDPNHNIATSSAASMMGFGVGGMMGSTKSQVGNSIYAGVQMPGMLTADGKFGLEYNQGSKWWRSFTYGEDTMIGSKLAARGKAYEAYYTQPILGKVLTGQLRYTYIKYDYTGSNAFFGDEGHPYEIGSAQASMFGAVKEASDIRAYLRYRY